MVIKGSRGNAYGEFTKVQSFILYSIIWLGFHLSSLNNVADTKASVNKKITFLHYLVTTLKSKVCVLCVCACACVCACVHVSIYTCEYIYMYVCNVSIHVSMCVHACIYTKRAYTVAAVGGLGGLEPPNFPQRGAEPLQIYICVTSSTSRER